MGCTEGAADPAYTAAYCEQRWLGARGGNQRMASKQVGMEVLGVCCGCRWVQQSARGQGRMCQVRIRLMAFQKRRSGHGIAASKQTWGASGR